MFLKYFKALCHSNGFTTGFLEIGGFRSMETVATLGDILVVAPGGVRPQASG